MKRTSHVTIGWALVGLWITFIGWVVANAAVQALLPLAAIVAALERAVS